MTREIEYNGLTVTIEAEAQSECVMIGTYDSPSEYETYWVREPEIVDVHNNYYDVTLTREEEKEIIDGLDLNDFVC